MKKKWLWLGLIAISLALAVWLAPGYYQQYQESRIDAGSLLDQALTRTAAASSFRYQLESILQVDGRKEVISRVSGEKNQQGSIHIKGEMVKTPVDIYHFNRTVYNWDSFSKRWLVIKDAESNSAKVLISELDPLSNFNFKQINDLKKDRWEAIDGERCLVLRCKPSVENELMEILWKDFRYEIWVDVRDQRIRKANLTAVSRNNPDTFLQMMVGFDDFGQPIKIEEPKIP
ncbi:MAG: hypothetical protein ACM3QZ_08870 [Solirubrobacterales bacterium]